MIVCTNNVLADSSARDERSLTIIVPGFERKCIRDQSKSWYGCRRAPGGLLCYLPLSCRESVIGTWLSFDHSGFVKHQRVIGFFHQCMPQRHCRAGQVPATHALQLALHSNIVGYAWLGSWGPSGCPLKRNIVTGPVATWTKRRIQWRRQSRLKRSRSRILIRVDRIVNSVNHHAWSGHSYFFDCKYQGQARLKGVIVSLSGASSEGVPVSAKVNSCSAATIKFAHG